MLFFQLFRRYATDQDAFFKQYADSLQAMIEMTQSAFSDYINFKIPVHSNLVKEGDLTALALADANDGNSTSSNSGYGSKNPPKTVGVTTTKTNDSFSIPRLDVLNVVLLVFVNIFFQ